MVSERGFTLVEVVVAMTVLAFGVLGVLQAMLVAARLEERGRDVTAGWLLAQESLERVRALGWERATADLALADLPASLGMAGRWRQRAVDRPGVPYLLVYEREETATPRCTVHCFWERTGGAFDPRRAVRLSARWRR